MSEFEMIWKKLRLLYTEEEAWIWLRSDHPLLERRRPSALIVAGRGEEVAQILDQLLECAYL
jgi:uncharacterized protein (DUF2384 family)